MVEMSPEVMKSEAAFHYWFLALAVDGNHCDSVSIGFLIRANLQ
jgi:hypothetical protein